MAASVFTKMTTTSKEGGKFLGGTVGKALTGAAGILLLVGILRETFYLVKVGQRGVLMRGGMPVKKKNGKLSYRLGNTCLSLRLYPLAYIFLKFAGWRRRKQVGTYKIKRPGVRIKFPGWYGVDKVNVQRRVQRITPFDVDCTDGQIHVVADMVTRVPCDDDGMEYADYPARSIIKSSEADDVFESWAGTTLLTVLETCDKQVRQNREQLFQLVNEAIGHEFDEVGYLLEGVNVRSRARTFPQVLVDGPRTTQVLPVPTSDGNVAFLPYPPAGLAEPS